MTVPYLIGRESVTVMVDGVTTTVTSTHINYNSLREAVRNKDWDAIPALVTPVKTVEDFGKGNITVVNGEVCYRGEVMHNALTVRILDMIKEGFDANPLINFLDKLMNNPSRTAVTELYDWLERTSLPITEDGDFLAYKKVDNNYVDFFSGQITNKPASLMSEGERARLPQTIRGITISIEDNTTVLSMPRNMVDDVRDRTCSYGLHFCSMTYLPYYHGGSGRVLIVKINPANVVSIPNDYNFAKGRTCQYSVIGEHASENEEAYTSTVVSNTGETIRSFVPSSDVVKPDTTVMGIDFITEVRATMTRELVESVINTATDSVGRNSEQGRMDGFNAAWENLMPSLDAYQGMNVREAVEYARAYFEGYDRCRGRNEEVESLEDEDTEEQEDDDTEEQSVDDFAYENDEQENEIIRVLKLPLTYNPSYRGYDVGYDEGESVGHYAAIDQDGFHLDGVTDGDEEYRRGYIDGYLDGYNNA